MKRLLFLIPFIMLLSIACSKKKTHCYECDTNKDGVYEDYGCMTKEEWNKLDVTASGGVSVKNTCRER